LKKQDKPNDIEPILEGPAEGEGLLPGESSGNDAEQDPLYDDALVNFKENYQSGC